MTSSWFNKGSVNVKEVTLSADITEILKTVIKEDGTPFTSDALKDIIRDIMSNHKTTDYLPTFHFVPIGNYKLLIDNGPYVIRVMRAIHISLWDSFEYLHNQYVEHRTVH